MLAQRRMLSISCHYGSGCSRWLRLSDFRLLRNYYSSRQSLCYCRIWSVVVRRVCQAHVRLLLCRKWVHSLPQLCYFFFNGQKFFMKQQSLLELLLERSNRCRQLNDLTLETNVWTQQANKGLITNCQLLVVLRGNASAFSVKSKSTASLTQESLVFAVGYLCLTDSTEDLGSSTLRSIFCFGTCQFLHRRCHSIPLWYAGSWCKKGPSTDSTMDSSTTQFLPSLSLDIPSFQVQFVLEK